MGRVGVPDRHALAGAYRWHRPLMAFAGAMAVVAAVAAVGVFADHRILVGVPVWTKPLKFAVSFLVYAPTLAWLLSKLTRGRRIGWWSGTLIAAGGVVEMAIVVGQVVRGHQSHFNLSTPLDGLLFNIMGGTITVLFGFNLLVAALLLRQRIGDPALTWAIRLGMLIMLGGFAAATLMLAPTAGQRQVIAAHGPMTIVGAHSVGVPDGGPSLPVLGWSATGGDLRIGHFLGLHGLQVVPLLVLLFGRFFAERARVRLVFVAAAGYAGLVLLAIWQALRGQPLIHPDLLTLGALAGLVAAVAAAGLVAVRTAADRTTTAPAGLASA
jgi:hypothetical protein